MALGEEGGGEIYEHDGDNRSGGVHEDPGRDEMQREVREDSGVRCA